MESALPPSNQHRRRSGIGSFIVLVLLIIFSILLWLNHQYIIDSVHFWRFQPTAEIAKIAERSAMSDTGKFTFYAAQPRVDGSVDFNSDCSRQEKSTAILGCYVNDKIYIYDVTDSRLDGIKEVTAAHEMLHAVYERLSPSDKATVDKLVEAEYDSLKSNPDFAERMAFYARTEPGERDNELHSIIGTEVGSVSSELEAHYSRYFTDRTKIVALHAAYDGAFSSLAAQAKQLSTELDKSNQDIKTASAKYNTDVKALNVEITEFNARASSGVFRSQAQFNAERTALMARATTVSEERDSVDRLIDEYNKLRERYNGIVTQSNDLYKSIDSTLAPAPKV